MTRTTVAVFFLLLSIASAGAGQPQVAFERGKDIWAANLDGTNARKIARGSGPELSPDGARIAFNTDTSTSKEVIRQIAVADVTTKHITIFKDQIPSPNCYGAVWSPDGKRIVFYIWTDNDWHLGLIGADGSGFRYLKKTETKGNSFWSVCWAPDGGSIYAQDLNNLYQLDLDGKELRRWKLDSLFPGGSFSSASTFAVSADGKKALADVESDTDEVTAPDWDGPASSVWLLDLQSEKASRLTPKGLMAWHPSWIDANNFLFAGQSRTERNPSIYRASLGSSERERKLLIKNGNAPTAARNAPGS